MRLIIMGGRRTIARPWLDPSDICYLLLYIRCRGWALRATGGRRLGIHPHLSHTARKPGDINPSMLHAAAKYE